MSSFPSTLINLRQDCQAPHHHVHPPARPSQANCVGPTTMHRPSILGSAHTHKCLALCLAQTKRPLSSSSSTSINYYHEYKINDRRNCWGTLWQKVTWLNLIWASIWLINLIDSINISIISSISISSIRNISISIYYWLGNYIYRHICSNFFRSVRRFYWDFEKREEEVMWKSGHGAAPRAPVGANNELKNELKRFLWSRLFVYVKTSLQALKLR